MKKFDRELVRVLIKMATILVIIITIICGLVKYQLYNYNNGVCRECNGHYEFVNGSGYSGHNSHYFYKCDNCNKVIELRFIPQN